MFSVVKEQNKSKALMLLLGVGFLILTAVGCSTIPDCYEETRGYVNIGFYSDFSQKDTTLKGFSVITHSAWRDTLYYKQNNIGSISLPLSQNDDSSEFTFVFTVSTSDGSTETTEISETIQFNYLRDLNLISNQCGFAHYYSLQEISSTSEVMKGYQIIVPVIEITDEEHIKIFL